jgi:four helix bundle suffix protein
MTPEKESLIPKHGGYRKLKSFQVAQLVYDVTVRFCDRYISRRSRTHDQMVQAARSGVQNIAEGSQAAGTSKKTELKLTNVARASLEELRLDYEDFLRQRSLPLWERKDRRRTDLISRRCPSADAVAHWVREQRDGQHGQGRSGQQEQKISGQHGQKDDGLHGQANPEPHDKPQAKPQAESTTSTKSMPSNFPEIAANAALVLIAVACSLLDRQLAAQAAAFEQEGGFTERLYRVRKNARRDGR